MLTRTDDNLITTASSGTGYTASNGYEIEGTFKDSNFIKQRFTLFSPD